MKLLTVEEVFLIEGRGVVVLPLIPEYSGPTSFSVILRTPNGEESLVKAHLSIPRTNSQPPNYSFMCLLAEVSKLDVPIGTEIWISPEQVA